MPLWLQIIIVASTLAGLGFAGFGIWFAAKRQENEIGLATSELEQTVSAQQKALEAAQKRIQNLEAIVTSQEWDVIHDGGVPEAKTQPARSDARLDLDALEDEPSDTERAAQITRRLKT
ncbi:MAG: hypothetical protein Rubg2KO_40410 [Rubricoccaceae bacterium]